MHIDYVAGYLSINDQRSGNNNSDRCFSYVCIYLTLGTSGSNVLYTTETYIGSHYTVRITLHHDQEDRTHEKKKISKTGREDHLDCNENKIKETITRMCYASKMHS